MADIVSPRKRSEIMRSIKSNGGAPEIYVRKALHAAGYRYRLNAKELPGKPDIVLPRHRVALFVHGCFWHRHDGCAAARMPQSNRDYWEPKLTRNVERDLAAVTALVQGGWRVRLIWTCELRSRVKANQAIDGLVRWLRSLSA